MRLVAVLLTGAMLAPAQVRTEMNPPLAEYSAPWFGSPTYWKKTFTTPDTRVMLQPPVKLRDYVLDGKLRLSLRAYLDLVVANNTDIGVQKLTLEIPKNAIQRAFSVFDPFVTTSFSATRAQTPTTNALEGAAVLSSLTQPFNLRYQQTLPTSTTVFSSVNWNKNSNNNAFQVFNPAYQNTWQMGFNQPLLRGFGSKVIKLPITIARAQKRVQDLTFNDTVLRLLVTSENTYWDVISARERLRVQREALKLAEAALERARKEVELGATSPLEIYQPEQNAATARINVTQVEYQLRQFEDVLRRQIGADLDPDIRTLSVELTEDVSKSPEETVYNKEELVNLAMTKRPDLASNLVTQEVNELQIRSAREFIKPNLTLSGSYSTFGRGGPATYTNVPGGPLFVPGGAGDAWGQMFGFDFPTYQFSLTLNLPIRDRNAAANLADAVVNKRLTVLRQRGLEQQVRQEVLNAITQVESSREGVKLAQIALDYARKRAEADQRRYDLGVINIFFLLSAQNDLTLAESNLVNQTVQYKRNLLNLQQRVGTLFEDKGIVIQ
jgi:outer membrane protein TolC